MELDDTFAFFERETINYTKSMVNSWGQMYSYSHNCSQREYANTKTRNKSKWPAWKEANYPESQQLCTSPSPRNNAIITMF